jgi:solute carrier family 25 (mitochondrial folate transporter), member 32
MLQSEFAIGTLSSLISYSLTYPIDTIKTNYQTKSLSERPVLKDVVQQIYRTQGLKGYYRGVGSTLATYPLFWGIFFQTNSTHNVMIASGLASLCTNPLFVLKTRFQSNANQKSGKVSYFNLTKNIYHNEGVGGFFKGFSSTLVNNTKMWIQFFAFDEINKKTDNIAMSSMLAKIISSTIYYPTDLIRTNQRNLKDNQSMFEIGNTICKANGIRGLYHGVFLYTMVSVPNFLMLMVIRDRIKKYYN